jgi:WD40 repeat protein
MILNPFKFLDSYTLADRDIFFGRESEIEEIYSRLFHSKLLLIYGPSGSGKTSLLQCGVSNRFGEQNWKPVFIRRKQHIIESIHAEIEKQAITSLKKEKTVTEKLYSLYLDYLTPVYLIFDQFEELFIFGEPEEKKEFVSVLKDILSHEDINTQVILSIREEYLASMSEFEDELPRLFENRIRIEKMKKARALSVILSPCEVCHVGLEKGLPETAIERIINESATIELTWLQVLMDRLYKAALARNEEPVEIRLSDLEALGQIGDVLGSFLEEQLKQMPEGAQGEAVLKTLVSSEGTKRQLTLEEIKDHLEILGYRMDTGDIKQFVQHFITVRILNDKDENDRYELRHDSLAAKIFERLTLAERELQEVRQFVENAYKSYLKTEHLLGKRELNYVSKYEDKLFLKDETAAFLEASKQVLLSAKRTQQRVKIYSIISFLLLCTSLGFWAIKDFKESVFKKMSLSAIFLKDDDPKTSLYYSAYSYKQYETPLASKALFETFYNLWARDSVTDSLGHTYSPYRLVFDFKPCKSEILFADYSIDGEYIYGYLADTTIMVWSQYGKELFHFKVSKNPILQLKMSPDNNFLSCFHGDSTACLFSASGKVLLETKVTFDLVNPSRVMAFSADSRQVAYAAPGNKVALYFTDGDLFQVLENHNKAVTAIDFSNDGQFLATASKDHTIVIYYFNQEIDLYDVYSVIDGHKDIVWSVEFAKSKKYVLSASEDSTIGIWNFSGEDVLKSSLKENRALDFFNDFKTKFADAIFSPQEDYLIFRQYDIAAPDSGKLICFPWKLTVRNPKYNYVRSNQIKVIPSGIIYESPSGEIRFISHKMQKYFCFDETLKKFSVNDSNMFVINNTTLNFYPVSEKKILDLFLENKIFIDITEKDTIFESQQFDSD